MKDVTRDFPLAGIGLILAPDKACSRYLDTNTCVGSKFLFLKNICEKLSQTLWSYFQRARIRAFKIKNSS